MLRGPGWVQGFHPMASSSWRTSASGSVYSSEKRTPVRMSKRFRTVAPAYPEYANCGT